MDTESAIQQIGQLERVTLSERVYVELRELLMAGKLRPAEKLSLRSVASALGVSIMPVREAVSRLVAEGALSVTPNRAVHVPLMTREKLFEIMTVRLQIEGYAVEQAAVNHTADEIAQIVALEQEFCRSVREADIHVDTPLRLNKDLHFAIYRASHLPTLVSIIEGLWLKVGPVINMDLGASHRLAGGEAVIYHDQLVQALKDRSAEKARASLVEDIRCSSEFIIASGQLPQ